MGLDNFNSGSKNPNKKSGDLRYKDKEWLHQKYVEEGKTEKEIASTVSVARSTIQYWVNKFNLTRMYSSEKLSEDNPCKFYVIGCILSDGSLVDSENCVSLEVIDEEFASEFIDQLSKWTGLNENNITTGERIQNGSRYYRVQKKSEDIYDELINYKASNWTEWYMKLNTEEKESLVRGLWDGEGSISKRDGIVRFTNKDRSMLELYVALMDDLLEITEDKMNITSEKESGAKDVVLRKKHTDDFISTVEPSISRKINAVGGQ